MISVCRLMALAVPAGAAAMLACAGSAGAGNLERGKYLADIMDCTGCHTTGALAGKPDMKNGYLAGSDVGFAAPGLGVFFPPNLTSDKKTGLGTWTRDEIIAAFTKGERPDGRQLAPVMPWRSYAALTRADAEALASYLMSLPPVRHQVPGPFGPQETPPAPYLGLIEPGK